METRKIKLSALEGMEDCSLAVDLHDNGDYTLTLQGHDEKGTYRIVRAQVLSVTGGGGNAEQYRKMVQIFKNIPKD